MFWRLREERGGEEEERDTKQSMMKVK